jgi:hypothetical protein
MLFRYNNIAVVIKNIIENAAFLTAEDSWRYYYGACDKGGKTGVSEDWEGLFAV